MIRIGKKKFEHKLTGLFWTYKPKDEEDEKLFKLLNRICHAWLVERNGESQHEIISSISLNEEERKLVIDNNLMEHPNTEVRARCLDVMIRFAKGKERIDRLRKASDDYLTLYEETGTVFFFVRSIDVRKAKTLYDDHFLTELRDVVIKDLIHPGWLTKALCQVKKSRSEGIENAFIQEILDVYKAEITKHDYYWVDSYWDMLNEIGAIDKKEWHYQKALNWELYADKIEANKKEKVFNINLHEFYQDAYKVLYPVKDDYPDDFNRIKIKYNEAKKDFVEVMSLHGVKIKYEIPERIINHIHKQISSVNLVSIEEAVIYYLNIPFFTAWKESVEAQVKQSIEHSDVMERLFPNSQTLDDEGNVSGISSFEKDRYLQVHRFTRVSLMFYILNMFERVGEHALDYSEGLFFKMLKACKPSFIEDDRIQIWAKAYNYYFSGDIVIASHLLMPQFEHALHNLLEEIVGDVTKLNAKIQYEPTLKAILNLLKPYSNPALYDELSFFLEDGNDVNYRNKLMHGFLWSMDMFRYGHYLFYLANLLFFKGKEFLHIGEDDV